MPRISPKQRLSRIARCAMAALLLCCALPTLAQDNTAAAAPKRVTTATGLQYEDIKVGTGPAAKAGAKVAVHYTGWLHKRDGTTIKPFDTSRERGEPFEFLLGMGQVIPGWDEGVQGMQVGGVRKLYIPSALGYGAQGAGRDIPPNSKLIFEVELLGLQ